MAAQIKINMAEPLLGTFQQLLNKYVVCITTATILDVHWMGRLEGNRRLRCKSVQNCIGERERAVSVTVDELITIVCACDCVRVWCMHVLLSHWCESKCVY